jgi:hypothetical protein
MRFAAKGLLLAIGLVAVPVTISLMGGVRFSEADPLLQPSERRSERVTYLAKDESRLPAMSGGRADQLRHRLELAQAGGAAMLPMAGALWRMKHPSADTDPIAVLGRPPHLPLPSPRRACEEDIDLHAALAGYLKSKLRLQGAQLEAWQKIEVAAFPAVEALRRICAELPDRGVATPSVPNAFDHAQRRLAATAEFLQAIREPLRALYDTLSPDQRAVLEPLPPPPM